MIEDKKDTKTIFRNISENFFDECQNNDLTIEELYIIVVSLRQSVKTTLLLKNNKKVLEMMDIIDKSSELALSKIIEEYQTK